MKLKVIGNYFHQYILIFHGYLGGEHKDIKRACFHLKIIILLSQIHYKQRRLNQGKIFFLII